MTTPHFFGYGSLVNRATHVYDRSHPARLEGWRRVWKHTNAHPFAFLSVRPSEGDRIDGLIAEVPGNDWAALDLRETGYDRHDVSHAVDPAPGAVAVYAVGDGDLAPPDKAHPILLSYLDVVVQGFLQVYGTAGAERFFASTEGWHAPILNDRATPNYPRHQRLEQRERDIVDAALRDLSAKVTPA